MGKDVCKRLHFDVTYRPRGYRGDSHLRIRAFDGVRSVGELEAETRRYHGPRSKKRLGVTWVAVDPDYVRCGIGTRLYTVAAHKACVEGMQLASDDLRSPYSQGFWEKQVKKGRARCMRKGTYEPPHNPGKLQTAYNRGDCVYYALTAPCPVTSLDGKRRR